ncbi:putative Type III site-specific deoxyribonuclease [Mycoplasmopsis fermentans JER]|nr:putative Type III site-specific deoxyribonuclease [Mycoplasmopsis fermentans JER]
MLNERLIMARDLLKEDGVIFVSIDDIEQAYLKILMDQIFGEENFIACMPYISNLKGRQANTNFALTHEYILCYSKSNSFEFQELEDKYATELMPQIYKERNKKIFKDTYGYFILQNRLENTNSKFNKQTRSNLYYPLYIYKDRNEYRVDVVKTEKTIAEIFPKKIKNIYDGVWRWEKEKVVKDNHDLYVKFEANEFTIWTKKRNNSWTPKSIIMGPKLNTKNGNDLLENICENIELDENTKFNTCKNIDLINYLINIKLNNKEARILDFFAGSGTTGHAILEMNKKDGGKRQFTLVTNDENNVGTKICYERLYRINNGKGTDNSTSFAWLKKNTPYKNNLDIFNIKYYKTELFDETDSLDKIVEIYEKELKDFNVKINKNTDISTFYYDLLALKPIEKSEGK